MSDNIDTLKDEEKEKLDYVKVDPVNVVTDTESQQPARSHSNNWLGGVILIAIGVIFLFSNISGFYLNNWWALFILIPAIGSFGKAWNGYRENGRLDGEARGGLIGGLILTLVASAFLFNLDWGMIWPLFLIIGGVGALLGGWLK